MNEGALRRCNLPASRSPVSRPGSCSKCGVTLLLLRFVGPVVNQVSTPRAFPSVWPT